MKLTWACPRSVWRHVLDRSPQATFFHTPAWADVVRAQGLGETCTLLASWPDGRMALCVLGLRPVWRGLVRAARCGIAGGYGGLVTTGPLGEAEQRAVYQALWRRYGTCGGCTNPFAPPPPGGSGFTLQPSRPTLAIRLAPLPELRRRYHQDRLAAVTTYQRAGVGLRLIERPCADDWLVFRQLHDLDGTDQRHGGPSPSRPADGFRSLQQAAGTALKLIVATVDGQPGGMLVYAIQGRIATVLHQVRDRRFDRQEVATALQEACLDACGARGVIWLDLLPDRNRESERQFKASFGAEPLPIWDFDHASWPVRGLRLLKPAPPSDLLAS